MKYELLSGIPGNAGIVDDLTVRDAALVYDFDQNKLNGFVLTTEAIQSFRDEHINFLMSILEARGSHRMKDIDVLVFAPEKPEPEHPFQMNDVRLFLPAFGGRQPRNTDLYELAQTRTAEEGPGPLSDSRKVRKIIGEPDAILVETDDRTAYRLVKEITALKRGLATANDIDVASYQAIIAVLGEKLLRTWIEEAARNLKLSYDRPGNWLEFQATAPRIELGRSIPKRARLRGREKWMKIIEESGRFLPTSSD